MTGMNRKDGCEGGALIRAHASAICINSMSTSRVQWVYECA